MQTAKGNYTSKKQHNFIGFKVSKPVLERAFLKVYGLELSDLFKSLPVAVESFRFIVKHMFPELTRDAWKVRKSLITKLNPLAEKASYRKSIDRKSYIKEFGRPRPISSLLIVIMGIVPKVGPFASLKFKEPTDEVEKLFDKSFSAIINHYNDALVNLRTQKIKLDNINYDTGNLTTPGEYHMADDTYYQLLNKQKRKNFEDVDQGLKTDILKFYSSPKVEVIYKKKPAKMKKINRNVAELKKVKT